MKTALELTATTPLYEIAILISKDWKKVYYGAKPYIDAMGVLNNISDRYGYDDAKSVDCISNHFKLSLIVVTLGHSKVGMVERQCNSLKKDYVNDD